MVRICAICVYRGCIFRTAATGSPTQGAVSKVPWEYAFSDNCIFSIMSTCFFAEGGAGGAFWPPREYAFCTKCIF